MAVYKRVPTQFIIAAYHKEDEAEKTLQNLVEAMADEQIVVTNIALAKRDAKGKVRVKELGKAGVVKGLIGGTAAGGAAGAALGGTALALLGPIGVTVGAATGGLVGGALGSVSGAVVGAAGKVATEGMDKDHLKSLGSALEPSTSAIIAVFSEVTVSKHKFREELKERKEGIDEIVNLMATDITEKLRNDLDVAYHMAIMEDGVVMTQVTMDCFAANITQMVLTPDAATAKQVTVTPKVAAAEEMVVTGEGVAGAAAVITPHAVEYETEEFEA